MVAMNLQTSFLTPPFGFSLFYLRGVAPEEVPTTAIYRGALPFIAIQVVAFEPGDLDDGVLQGGNAQVGWTGDRWAVVWIHNRRGHLFVRTTAAVEGVQTGITDLTPDYEDRAAAPDHGPFVAGTPPTVSWSTEGGLRALQLARDGRAAGPEVEVASGLGGFVGIRGLWTRPDGFTVLFGADREDYRLRSQRLDADARPVGPSVVVVDEPYVKVGGLHGDRLLWGRREAGRPDIVYLSTLDAEGRAGDAQEVYRSESADGFYLGAGVAGIWDFDRGLMVLSLNPLRETRLADGGHGRAKLLPLRGELALLRGAGAYRPTNPLSTELVFRLGDETLDLNAGTRAAGTCLEHFAAAVAGGRVGVVWVEGCDTRRLYFSEVRRRQP